MTFSSTDKLNKHLNKQINGKIINKIDQVDEVFVNKKWEKFYSKDSAIYEE